MASQDTELTLSTGKLLGFFFGMVVVCGIFFSLGYLVGKGSSQAGAPVMTDSAANSNLVSSGGSKPSAGHAGAVPSASATTTADVTAADSASDPNYQKALQQKDSNPQLSAPEPSKTEVVTKADEKKNASILKTVAPELASAGTGFMVQVAAVSKQEDADALVKALRKKEYPVFVVNQPNSNLFHVQVGPFAQQKDAEAMRAKLAGDGYNAILKK
ncbi:MAG: Sporulation related protein [Candidatus Angelobacter sp.]|jgi:DedD protein|nr:Sporulation related protein [Candidatus Angelobacter sp.]